MSVDICPICRSVDAKFYIGFSQEHRQDCYDGSCRVCGNVRILSSVVGKFEEAKRLHLLSACFRKYPSNVPLITLENVDEFIRNTPRPRTVIEKMNALLLILAHSGLPPGMPVEFLSSADYPLVFAANEEESQYLLDQLERRRLISTSPNALISYVITADGYEHVERLETAAAKPTRNAFVAMWFAASRDEMFNSAIQPAVENAGYRAIRIDKTEHVNSIDDEIIAQLKQSRFLVADFTGQRAGVYYEAGFMHGLGRNVYWMVEKDELKDVHFDLRQFNFIDYESVDEAKRRLYDRIMAVEGAGPRKANE